MQLSKAEEQLMEVIWKYEKVFMKDLIDSYPDPKPASTTIATLLKRMQDKGFVAYNLFGNSRQYYALVKKSDYFSKHVKGIIENFFNNSPIQFASFFTTSTDLSSSELEDLKKIVEQEIKRKEQ
ncbi:BlaI/MecI/CopY family transcriptional regulator [Arcicella sp. DC2W]|uniref:BlaI/MecI/CopY family transcriptional regulator n=1 Tax=Arcicella gelida TaxID=2984195 RepID=A0ABU5S205_9BACT|nr:BlaI/MecI/CopY family transcriptional regulator [Arcicella sp. DC2W]MEA5402505.1 BlaI/MecI/CopY family transcriptional regulator [Arcicella sp. DC2W]